MKLTIFLLLFYLIIISGCKTADDCSQTILRMYSAFDAGNFSLVRNLAGSAAGSCKDNPEYLYKADSLAMIAERISIDFSLNEEEVNDRLAKMPGYTPEDKLGWEKKGWLEYRLIDGKKMYFRRAVSNLVLLKKFYEEKELILKETAEDSEMIFRLKHTAEAYRISGSRNNPVLPENVGITYTITVHPDAVPDGEKVRCWMPWPKSNHPRQNKVVLLNTSNPEYMISPDTAVHSSLYMEETAKKGVPVIFRISYSYETNAQYFNLQVQNLLPYNKESDIYKKYTSEQLPHINFSKNIKQLADSIAGSDDNPAIIVKKLYYWFFDNIPWTGALEYSIIPDIPEYVIHNRRGDCGMKNFLFISMLRYKGIPARWQSGFMVPPDHKNLHDWCEVYYEGAGWIPVDVDYGLQQSEITGIREFYLSGIDAYRLILNDGVSGRLHPAKLFVRSEPYDFQRGEVEYSRGNLYFDKWDYDIKIDYLNKKEKN